MGGAPNAFTDLGVAILSSVLNSDRAVRAFVKLRGLLASHKGMARKIGQLEASQRQQALTQAEHGSILVAVVQDIQRLKHPPTTRTIGFIVRSPRKK
jgi:hypothetical protein